MNPQPIITSELQVRLTDKILGLLDWIENTEGFVAEQAPLVVNEIIIMGRINGALALTVLCLSALWLVSSFCNWMNHRDSDDFKSVAWGVIFGLSCIISIPSTLVSLQGIYVGLMAHFAPRLFVLEYLRNLL